MLEFAVAQSMFHSAALLVQANMRPVTVFFLFALHLACLQKALSGPSSSSKRKREDSSEDWGDFSVNLQQEMSCLLLLPKSTLKRDSKQVQKQHSN